MEKTPPELCGCVRMCAHICGYVRVIEKNNKEEMT